MSVQKDVVLVLDEFSAIQIFEGFIEKFNDKYPRAVEILLGILVNMATLSGEISLKLVNNSSLVRFLLFDVLLKMADVPSVVQVVFLLTVFVSGEKGVQTAFFQFVKNEFRSPGQDDCPVRATGQVNILQTLFFILEQSLNSTLLDATLNFILLLIDNDEQVLELFADDARFVDALCNAAQTRLELERTQRANPALLLETPSTVRPSQARFRLFPILIEMFFHLFAILQNKILFIL